MMDRRKKPQKLEAGLESEKVHKQIDKRLARLKMMSAILATVVSSGPVGWFFIDYYSNRYDRLPALFVASMILSVFVYIQWASYFRNKNNDTGDSLV